MQNRRRWTTPGIRRRPSACSELDVFQDQIMPSAVQVTGIISAPAFLAKTVSRCASFHDLSPVEEFSSCKDRRHRLLDPDHPGSGLFCAAEVKQVPLCRPGVSASNARLNRGSVRNFSSTPRAREILGVSSPPSFWPSRPPVAEPARAAQQFFRSFSSAP